MDGGLEASRVPGGQGVLQQLPQPRLRHQRRRGILNILASAEAEEQGDRRERVGAHRRPPRRVRGAGSGERSGGRRRPGYPP